MRRFNILTDHTCFQCTGEDHVPLYHQIGHLAVEMTVKRSILVLACTRIRKGISDGSLTIDKASQDNPTIIFRV